MNYGQADKDKPAGKMPTRTLGNTKAKVSLLGFGGGSQWLAAKEDDALKIVERAIEAGMTYFDTAQQYGPDRLSERRYGMVLPKYRDRIFLATKTHERTYDAAMRSVEESLRCLKTDKLDLIQMHDVGPRDDIASWDKPTGALTALRKLKEQKVVRFIGFTGHQKAEVHRQVLQTLSYDTVLMALNAANYKPFRELALPVAKDKKMGIIAMKTTRGLVGEGTGKASARELLSWTWDQPGVCVAIVGMGSLEILNDNISHALAYKPGAVDTKALTARLEGKVSAAQLHWPMPGYRDA
jgi:aryl-alcohol dehydrogenase-like predicted oxidoreductase